MDYLIKTIEGKIFVTNERNVIVAGPYANEDSAKRRIRKFKSDVTVNPIDRITKHDLTVGIVNHLGALNPTIDNYKTPAGLDVVKASKLNISSAYGNFNHDALRALGEHEADAWVSQAYQAMDARKSRNGYRPAHRANRFK